mmetsp:Transcript_7189/g.15907  ORF Transcript_7189/g.15907 Transcript_7189/m.15907 type:complete len:122 (-) Transcript_7189:220-585(-)
MKDADATVTTALAAAHTLEEQARALSMLFAPPFECQQAIDAHAQCMRTNGKDFSRCTATQDAMDSCIENGEKRRFRIESKCRSKRRIYMSCLLQGAGHEFPVQMAALADCVREVLDSPPQS